MHTQLPAIPIQPKLAILAKAILCLCLLLVLSSPAFSPAQTFAQSDTDSGIADIADSPEAKELKQDLKDISKAIKDKTNIDLENQSLPEILEQIPSIIPLIIAIICIIPLLWGWKIVRLVYTFFFAFLFGSIAYGIVAGARPDQPVVSMIVSMLASGIGGALGWYSIKIGTALVGAIMLGNVMALLGLMVGSDILAVVLAIIGFFIGLILGWKSAYYYQALMTSLYSALIMGVCSLVALYEYGPTLGTIVGLAVFVVASVIGCIFQFKSVTAAESGKIGTATTAETKKKVEKAMRKK
jgi:hypothetical protein